MRLTVACCSHYCAEIENEKSKGEYFAQLFYKYYTEVYPAKIVFVSFLEVAAHALCVSCRVLCVVRLHF